MYFHSSEIMCKQISCYTTHTNYTHRARPQAAAHSLRAAYAIGEQVVWPMASMSLALQRQPSFSATYVAADGRVRHADTERRDRARGRVALLREGAEAVV